MGRRWLFHLTQQIVHVHFSCCKVLVLFVEKADSPYANLLSVNPGDENKPAIQKLAKALQSPEIKKFIEEHYNGAIIPAF